MSKQSNYYTLLIFFVADITIISLDLLSGHIFERSRHSTVKIARMLACSRSQWLSFLARQGMQRTMRGVHFCNLTSFHRGMRDHIGQTKHIVGRNYYSHTQKIVRLGRIVHFRPAPSSWRGDAMHANEWLPIRGRVRFPCRFPTVVLRCCLVRRLVSRIHLPTIPITVPPPK